MRPSMSKIKLEAKISIKAELFYELRIVLFCIHIAPDFYKIYMRLTLGKNIEK